MTIIELKKELGLSQKDLAQFFDMSYGAFANSTAKERYENALCRFYEVVKSKTTTEQLLPYLTKVEFVHEWQNFVYAMNSTELELREKIKEKDLKDVQLNLHKY